MSVQVTLVPETPRQLTAPSESETISRQKSAQWQTSTNYSHCLLPCINCVGLILLLDAVEPLGALDEPQQLHWGLPKQRTD